MSTLFKAGGWSVVYHPVNGELYIYRADRPGEMIINQTDHGYTFETYAHSDKLVASCATLFAELECDEE